ncbi:hypothetical protein SAMN05421543_11969 [Alicyclobacillus macrosporangiidus]|uniref:Uncharacterized protein n=1 Tax=Alicyclobacillus macrosporangiidus TaxID=392015 RepID=A0A1I7KV46_9BACL|nr:hypothetical protein SAMN05421543_11969 [Alicyclobacillus macrosporangiidus]
MTLQSTTDGMRFTPQMFLDYHTRRLGIQIEDIGVAPTVIVTWFTRVREALTRSVMEKYLPMPRFDTPIQAIVATSRSPLFSVR